MTTTAADPELTNLRRDVGRLGFALAVLMTERREHQRERQDWHAERAQLRSTIARLRGETDRRDTT